MEPHELRLSLQKLFNSTEVAMLTDNLFADIQALRDKALALCDEGDIDGARVVFREIADIIREGPPVSE